MHTGKTLEKIAWVSWEHCKRLNIFVIAVYKNWVGREKHFEEIMAKIT